jgi:hypothetical protein
VQKLIVELIYHVAQQVSDLTAGCSSGMKLPDLVTIVRQKTLAARKIERALFIETSHAGIANGVYVIGKILIDIELHLLLRCHICNESTLQGNRFFCFTLET